MWMKMRMRMMRMRMMVRIIVMVMVMMVMMMMLVVVVAANTKSDAELLSCRLVFTIQEWELRRRSLHPGGTVCLHFNKRYSVWYKK